MSSADIAPPPPWPMTMFGESRNGTGQTHLLRCRWTGVRHRRHLEPAVQVVRRARPLGRDHRGTKRIARCALLPNAAHSCGLIRPCSTSPDAAHRRLVGVDVADREPVFGIELAVPAGTAATRSAGSCRCRARPGRSPRTRPSASPWRRALPSVANGARVGVLQFVPAGLQLHHRAADALQDVQRLESGDHDRHPVLARPVGGTPRCPSRCRRARRPGTPAPGRSATP